MQEDLCIIQTGDDGPRFTAALLCFPSRWRLHEKLGKPLTAVHGPVPFYEQRLATPVDRFMARVKPGHIASRLNWSVMDDPAMYQPGGHGRQATNAAITPDNAGETLYLRVERQTLRRLPVSEAVLFGIRVHCYPHGDGDHDAGGGGATCGSGARAAGGDHELQEPQGLRFSVARLVGREGDAGGSLDPLPDPPPLCGRGDAVAGSSQSRKATIFGCSAVARGQASQ